MNKKKQLLLEIHLLYDYGINNLENKYNNCINISKNGKT